MVSVGAGLLALSVTGNFSGPSFRIVGFCNSVPALATPAVFLEPQVILTCSKEETPRFHYFFKPMNIFA